MIIRQSERIGVFGSFAGGKAANDIDFFIDDENYDIKDLINLKESLEKINERKVDIMLERT